MALRAGWKPPIPGLSTETTRTLRRLIWRHGAYALVRHVRALAKLDGLPPTRTPPEGPPRPRGRPRGSKDSGPRQRREERP
jgi:hypothetical protein